MQKTTVLVILMLGLAACGDDTPPVVDAGLDADAGETDGGETDGGETDGGETDSEVALDSGMATDATMPTDSTVPTDATMPGDSSAPTDSSMPTDGAVDMCLGVDCSGMTDMCNTGTCNPATGTCMAVPVADATVCDDGDACTTGDVCTSGTCAGMATDCSGSDGVCMVGVCNASGTCEAMSAPDGSTCDDMHACTASDMCGSGSCTGAMNCREPVNVALHGGFGLTSVLGNPTGGDLFNDGCGPGRVVVGIHGNLHSSAPYLQTLGLTCAPVGLTGSGLGPYTVSTGATTDLTARGGAAGSIGMAVSSACPANEVVVGFSLRSGAVVDQIALRCAALTVDETPTQFVLNVGTATAIAPMGGTGGTDRGMEDCPAGMVGVGAPIRAGDSVDGFGLGCVPLHLTYPLVAGAATATAERGAASGGVTIADACSGTGSLLVGYEGEFAAAGWFGGIRGICQSFEVVGPADAPTGVIARGATTMTPLRGIGTGGGGWATMCASGSVMTAFEGRAGALIDALDFDCSPIDVTGTTVTLGTPTTLPRVGGSGGSAFPHTACPAGEAASQAAGRAGDGLDAFAMGCSALSY